MRVELILEAIDRASRPIKAVANALLGVERAAKAGEGIKRIGQGLGIATQRAAGLAVVATGAAAGLAASMLDTASSFEKMQATLVTTEGSQDKARKAMSWVSDFAATTPYELDQVTEAFVRMRAYGFDPTNGMLKTIGDASSAMGYDLMQGVEAVADAVTGENERLKAFGITTSVNTKAKEVTYSYRELDGTMRKVVATMGDQADIAEKLTGIFNSRFAGAMDKQASTWLNIVANLKDAWTRFQLEVMRAGLFDWMRDKAKMLLDTVNKMAADGSLQKLATEIGQTIQRILVFAWELGTGVVSAVQTIAPYVTAIVEFVGGTRNAMLLLGGLTMLKPILLIAQGIGLLMSALVPLAPALMVAAGAARAFGIAMMSNPIGIVIGLIAALVAAGYYLYQNWAQIEPWLSSLWASIKAAAVNAWNGMIAWFASLGGRISSALSGAWSSVSAWFASVVWPNLPDFPFIADIKAKLEPLGQWVSGWISTAKNWFAGFTWPSLPPFASFDDIKAALSSVGQWVSGWIAKAANWFAGFTWPSLPPLGDVLAAIRAPLDGAAAFVSGWVTKAANWFAGFVWPKLPAIGNILADIQGALEPVIVWIDQWGGRLLGVFTNVFDKVGSFVGGAADKIAGAFGKVSGLVSSASEMLFGPSAASVSASAADIAKVSASAETARGMINAIAPAAQNAVSQAGTILASANFHSHGVSMMTTLAQGIKAGAASAVAAVQATVAQIRDYLPHSPAKVGPLNDLDRVQFGQTLAGAIHNGAPKAIAAARAIAAGLAATIPAQAAYGAQVSAPTSPARPVFAAAARPFASGEALSGGSQSRAANTSNVNNISVNFHIPEGGGDVIGKIRQSAYEVANIIGDELSRRERTKH